MKHLLSLSTHGEHLDIIGDDWADTETILSDCHRDGYELYRVAPYPWENIPPNQIVGQHLRFVVFLDALWNGKTEDLLRIFGDLETAKHFFGGLDQEALIKLYRDELENGKNLGVEYAVFHASQANLDGLIDWSFPWSYKDTVKVVSELINAVLDEVKIDFPILFENLWWPGGLRLTHPDEIDELLDQIHSENVGIVLDTGHVMNMNQDLRTEDEAIDYLLKTVDRLGEKKGHIRAVHLTRSLSAEYVKKCRRQKKTLPQQGTFWDRYIAAHQHVRNIDEHDPFDSPRIAELFQLIDPAWVVDEFYFKDAKMCRYFVQRQDKALGLK